LFLSLMENPKVCEAVEDSPWEGGQLVVEQREFFKVREAVEGLRW
jgi:hypothetical protein